MTGDASAPEPPFDIARAGVLGAVRHGFFGAAGGTHQFGYGGPGDVETICAMRAGAAHAILPGAPLQTPHQVHSSHVVIIGDDAKTRSRTWPDKADDRPVADAVVTARRDVVIGIVTADCGPVLFSDSKAGIVGAAHAGWRGAHGGILENTIAAMESEGARRGRICAALGPTIARPSYEVDAGFREQFTAADSVYFTQAPARDGIARWQFDLPAYIVGRLQAAGLNRIEALGIDTLANEGRYYSYRRSSQLGAPDYGRQLSAIAAG